MYANNMLHTNNNNNNNDTCTQSNLTEETAKGWCYDHGQFSHTKRSKNGILTRQHEHLKWFDNMAKYTTPRHEFLSRLQLISPVSTTYAKQIKTAICYKNSHINNMPNKHMIYESLTQI